MKMRSAKDIRRVISVFLVLSIVFTYMCAPVMASNVEDDVKEIEVLVLDEKEFEAYAASLEAPASTRGIEVGVASIAICRSGNTENCDVILSWAGYMISAFRYKEMVFNSTSLLFPVTYATFGYYANYITYNTSASTVCSITLGRIELPIDVEKVRISCDSTQVYSTSDAGWCSVAFLGNTVTIG